MNPRTRQHVARQVACVVLGVLLAAACAGTPNPDVPRTDVWWLLDAEQLSSGREPFNVTVLTRIEGSFLAMGTDAAGAVDVWSSTDGQAWSVTTPPEFQPPPGRGYEIRHLVAVGAGAVAIGKEFDPADDSFADVLTWVSTDGVTWRQDRSIGEQQRGAIVGFEGAVGNGQEVFFSDTDGLLRRDPSGRWEYSALPENCQINAPLTSYTDLGAMLLGFDTNEPKLGHIQVVAASICAVRSSGDVDDYRGRTELVSAESAASVGGSTVVVGRLPGTTLDELGPAVATRTQDGGSTWLPPVTLPLPDGLTDLVAVRVLTAVDGMLIATGEATGPGAVPIPVAWTSTDEGASWQATQLPPLGDDGWVSDVATHQGRIMILAQYGHGPTQTQGLIVNFEPLARPAG